MVSGNKTAETENKEFKKRVGFVQAEIVMVAPSDNSDIKEAGYYVYDEDKEPEYTGEKEVKIEDKDGKVLLEEEVKFVRIPFYLKDMKSDEIIGKPKTFYIYDYDVISRNNPENKQWINEQGLTTYAKSKDAIAAWFTMNGQLAVRPAKKGEKELYEFLRASYNLKWNDKENIAKILVNYKDLFKGKFKELQGDVEANAGTIIVPLIIRQKDFTNEETGESGTKDIEDIYNAFAPGNDYKFLTTKKEFTKKDVEAIQKKDAENAATPKGTKKPHFLSNLERAVLQMADESYGCKDTFHLGLAKDYDKSDFSVMATDKGLVGAGSPSVDGDDY